MTRKTTESFPRYALVGAGSNALAYALYAGLVFSRLAPEIASTAAFIAGVLMSYWFNKTWSFRTEQPHGRAFPRYVAAYVAGYALQIASLSALVRLAGVNSYLAQFAAMGLAAVTIFILLKTWVFRASSTDR